MRVFLKDAGKWCKVMYEDKEHYGIVAEGGQDKDALGMTYRAAFVFLPGKCFVTLIDWPDVISLGPAAKPPRF